LSYLAGNKQKKIKMKRIRLLLLFLSLMPGLQAQQDVSFTIDKEGKIIMVPKFKTYTLNIPELSYQTYTPASTTGIDKLLQEFIPETKPTALDERPMDMHILSSAYRPFFDVFTPMYRRMSPFALDFKEASIVPINEKLMLLTIGQQETWPLLGGQTDINSMLVWSNNRLTILGGASAGRFYTPYNASPEYSLGANLQLRYEMNDRMAVRTWGQYTHFSGKERLNPYVMSNPAFYNSTGVGGALEFMFNENFGVGGGVEYNFNYIKGRMEARPVFYPVFKTGKVSIGVW
jgi:hypothetical protein